MSGGIVLGLITGLTYGLLAVGIVLIFKANRFINLAHAQLGAVSALLLGRLVLEDGWSWWAAFPLVVVVGTSVGLLVERVVIRPMLRRKRNAVSLLLVTIGVAQLLLAVTYVPSLGPSNTSLYRRGYPLPFETKIDAGSFVLGGQHILILILVPLLIGGLAVFLQVTAWGKAIRAAASNPDAARLCGIPVARVSALAWGMAGGLSAVTAVLQAPSQGSFNAAALGPGLLLRSMGAAALGGFTSIPAALIGGLVIGEVEHITLAVKHQSGTAELMVLLVVVVILFARAKVIGRRDAGHEAFETPPPVRIPVSVRTRPLVRWAKPGASLLAFAVAVLVPVLPFFHTEAHRFQLVVALTMAITGVALTMLLGWAGQVSLGHFAVIGLGGYLAGKLEPHGFSLLLILAVAAVVGAAALAVVGIPALRLQGLTLALTTLGFAVVAPSWLFHQPWLGVRGQAAVLLHPAGVVGLGRLGSELSVYYAALLLLAVGMGAAARVRRSLPGRLMVAVRDNERAVASFGVVPASVKLSILALSGAFAAMSGVLWATSWRTISVDLVPPEASLVLLAIPVIGGLGSIGGAVVAALVIYLPAFFIGPLLTSVFGSFGRQIGFQLALGGLGLVVMPLAYPAGLAGIARDLWQRFLDRVASEVETKAATIDETCPLVVSGVAKHFGGLTVLDGVGLEVGPGEIVGLIGPNGAGKTTLMNVISGELPSDAGTVTVFGRDVTALGPEYRAHFGLGRNFQEAKLFPGLTTREALQVAMARTMRVGVVAAMVGAPWVRHAERTARRRIDEIVTRLGLEPWADTLTGDLSTGTRRIVELAAQLASAPRLLLLDEPTAGVAQREAELFGPLLRRIRDELDCSILIIEHDMPLLMGVCDRVYALDAGTVITMGTPEEVRHDPLVIASYLGTGEVAIANPAGPTADDQPRPAGPTADDQPAPPGRPPMTNPVLRVDEVDFAYGRLQVLFGVSLEVAQGEALALLGTNGAGKSTLLRIVAGLERPSAGRVELAGEDVTGREAEDLVQDGIVLVPGGRAVFADMTVAENLEMQAFIGRRRRREVRARRDEVLDVFPRLGERLGQRAGTLSGGEQQQLALAKALILDPKLLCIDELSLGLAPVVVQELLGIVARIRATGVSMILVEQSLNVAAAMCERAVFMEKGGVRFEGSVAELLERDDIARAVFLGGPAETNGRARR